MILSRKEPEAVLLYDGKTPALRSAEMAAEEAGYRVRPIRFSSLKRSDARADVIINCMGSRYFEDKAPIIAEYLKDGGAFINLGGAPFGIAVTDDGDCPETHKGILELDIGDSFTKVDIPSPAEIRVLADPLGADLPVCAGRLTEPALGISAAYSGLYSLSHQKKEGRQRHAELTPLAGIFDSDGDMLSALAVQIKYRDGGCAYLFTYDCEDPLAHETLRSVFIGALRLILLGEVLFAVRPEFPRYLPGETVKLSVGDIFTRTQKDLEFKVSVYDGAGNEVFSRTAPQFKAVALPSLNGGDYTVEAKALRGGECVCRRVNGFVIISDEDLGRAVSSYPRMTVDAKISEDFFVQNGRPVMLHGTTYFVTDVWQNCFTDFNLARCRLDLDLLKNDGFNILRSGNWVNQVEFYGNDGSICEYSRRALQAYFLEAARHGFTVQFTLGHSILNDWDRSKCAIHNPSNLKKVKRLVRSFAELFGTFPNVMLDILNEPSYSYKGLWQRVIPSGDSYERKAWNAWLKKKYKNISDLRAAWGEPASSATGFGDLDVPERWDFDADFCRTEHLKNHARAADFFSFAQESYDGWLEIIRKEVKEISPETVIIMGRDETLRVPQEQNGAAKGLLDAVNWHQWNRDGQLFQEYLLNRVKGRICCAQELGVYRYIDPRGKRVLSDRQVCDRLERKLMMGFGNWIQWQSFSDPDRDELCENMLGIYRSDRSATPAVKMIRELIKKENSAADLIYGRDSEAFPIVTVYSTSSHYSLYNRAALSALRRHIDIIYRLNRLQCDVIPENLAEGGFEDMIGSPKLIIIPGAMRLTESCWENLLEYVRKGAALLISGCIDEDEHFMPTDRISEIFGGGFERRAVNSYEKIKIDGREYLLDFKEAADYADVANMLSCVMRPEEAEVITKKYGRGKVIYCPLPVELSRNEDAAEALYRYAADAAGAENKVYKFDGGKGMFVYAVKYSDAVMYTVINEGPDGEATLKDLATGKKVSLRLAAGKCERLWVGR